MKKILYYVTDHGYGHASRTIAIIRELKKQNIEIVIRNTNAQSFLKKSLLGMKIIPGITDVGTIVEKDGLTINEKKSKKESTKWINSIDEISNKEIENLGNIPDLIISDISAMPFLVSKKLKIPSIAISNFSWYDAHDFLSDMVREKMKEAYDIADLAIHLPLGTNMTHFQNKINVGFASRIPTKSKIEIKEELGIKDEFLLIYAMGETKLPIISNNEKNVKIVSLGSKVIANNNVNNFNNYLEGQNLIQAADCVICKSGYGVLSECLTNGVPFYYVSDNKRPELKEITKFLNKEGFQNQINIRELEHLKINNEFFESLVKYEKIANDNTNIANIIKGFFK